MTTTDESELLRRVLSGDSQYTYFQPLGRAADEYIHWAETPDDRVYTGIPEFDAAMRGTAPGELTLIGGYTHSGKTLLITEMLIRNPQTPIVLFTPDETRPLVLTKLTAAVTGVGAEELERMIQEDDDTGRQLLRTTAEKFNRLAVFDEVVSTITMDTMFGEAESALGERPKAVVFDYARLLSGEDDMERKIRALKNWGKSNDVAMFVVTQSSRTSGAQGRRQGIDSVEYGGEALATHLITVRRKKYAIRARIDELTDKLARVQSENQVVELRSAIDVLEHEALMAADTVTVALVKNKRPPSRLVDDMDFRIDTDTGRLVAPLGAYEYTRPAMSASVLAQLRYGTQVEMFEGS